MLLFCIQIVLIALSMLSVAQTETCDTTCSDDIEFAVAMDAGSTSTIAYVFQFNVTEGSEILLSKTTSMQIKPALSYYANNMMQISKMRSDLNKLISFSKTHIHPPECIQTTPIILKATAGLRNIGTRMAEKILNQVRNVFRTSGYLFKDDQVSLLSGKDEAIYAWMSVNFESKTLEIQKQSSQLSPLQTYGIVEVGGGSAQIAFVPTSKIDSLKPDRVTRLQTHVKSYTLYSHSYLTKGLDEFKLRIFNVSAACQAGRCDGEIYTSECLHPDYIGELSFGPSRLQVRGTPYNGTSRFHHCMKLAETFLSDVDEVIYTAKDVPFIGLSNFYYLYDNMRQIEGKQSKPIYNNITFSQIYLDAEHICKSPVKDVPKIYRTAFLCMDLTYIVSFLDHYGFDMDARFILSSGTSWALGLVIHSLF